MSENVAGWIVTVVGIYLGAGLLFAVAFLVAGAERADPKVRGSSLGFRLLILPGTMALWPLLVRRWIKGSVPEENNAHRSAAARAEKRS